MAALFVEVPGVYSGLEGVDCWGKDRDARLYAGPHPVVAHPPCGSWSALRHQYRGAEGDCGPRAVQLVRTYGGVLEQPAGSKLWQRCGIPLPHESSPPGSFSVEVEQVSWGHVARKRTWLYCVGIPLALVASGNRTGGTPTHWVSGSRGNNGRNSAGTGGGVPPGIKVCSSEQRNRTPPLFATWLVELARSVA